MLFLGSCVPLGYSLYLNVLSQPAHTFDLEIGVPVNLDNISIKPELRALLAVKGTIDTRSVQEEDSGDELSYSARYQFPVTYAVSHQSGKVIKTQQTEINWDTGSRFTTSEQVDSHGGQLVVRHNLERFTVPLSGIVNIEFLLGPDDLYDAKITSPQLLVYDGLVDDLWLIVGGVLMLVVAVVLIVVGFVFLLSVYAAANTVTSAGSEIEYPVSIPEQHEGKVNQQDSYNKAMWIHLSGFSGYLVPFGNVIAPAILWVLWKEEDAFIDDQGREAVNFQLSILVYFMISILLFIIFIGIILMIGVGVFHVAMTVIAAIRSSQGISFRYPIIIRFIK